MKAFIESIGHVGSKAIVGGHDLLFDQPPNVPGGEDRGPSPLDVMSVSVGACAHDFAAAYLHARGVRSEGLRVEVTAEKARVPVPRIGRLELKVHLPAGLEEGHIVGVERAIKTCPAYGTLLHSPSVEIAIERPERLGTEELPSGDRAKLVG